MRGSRQLGSVHSKVAHHWSIDCSCELEGFCKSSLMARKDSDFIFDLTLSYQMLELQDE